MVKRKIIITIVLIVSGLIIVAIGSVNFYKDPFIQKNFEYHGTFNEDSDYTLDINFNSLNGLMPYRGIDPRIIVTLPETKENTTSIQVFFPKGGIMNKDQGIPREGNPIQLKYEKTESQKSVYMETSYLIYYSEGDYDAEVKITLESGQIIDKKFERVIHIGSWENYIAQIKQNNAEGLAWVVAGIAMITTASTFTKLLDWAYKYDVLKKKAFYE